MLNLLIEYGDSIIKNKNFDFKKFTENIFNEKSISKNEEIYKLLSNLLQTNPKLASKIHPNVFKNSLFLEDKENWRKFMDKF